MRTTRLGSLLSIISLCACGAVEPDGTVEESSAAASSAATVLHPIDSHTNQKQINAALHQGGVVYLKAGTYVIDDTIEMPSGSTLTGDRGAVIELASDANWPKYKSMIAGHSISNVHIHGFEINGNGPNNKESGGASTVCGKYYYTMLSFTSTTGLEVDHMYLHDNWNDIFKLSQSSNVKFHDNTVRREGHDVVYAIHSNNVWVFDNSIKIACNSGVRPDSTTNIYIYGNDITRDGGGYTGIEIQGDSEVWACQNTIHGLLYPPIENLSGAPLHTSGCPSAPAPSFPSAD